MNSLLPGVHVDAVHALVVNDQFTLRKGLKLILEKSNYIPSCDTAENGLKAIDLMKKHHYNLVFLDLNMPVMDGTTSYYHMRKYFPGCKVIILSRCDEKRKIIELVKAGIDGYLMVDTEEDELNKAIEAVLNGNKYFTPKIKQVWDHFVGLKLDEQNSFFNSLLSQREMEVLQCICKQLSARQIADQLNISEFTVNNHRSKIMKKMGVDNTVGLVMEAVKNKLISW